MITSRAVLFPLPPLTPKNEAIMEPWLQAEIRVRRDELYDVARAARLTRLAESGRSTGIRGRIADGAGAIGAALTTFADRIRA